MKWENDLMTTTPSSMIARRLIKLSVPALFSAMVLLCVSCMHTPPGDGVLWTASWYGKPFHGKATASGEIYDMHGLSAAHKTMPFGTRLRLTNPANGRSVIVTINDRGPFVAGRDLDLSYGAARKLDMLRDGVVRLRVETLGRNGSYPVEQGTIKSGFALQAASFGDPAAADRVRDQVADAIATTPTRVIEASDGSRTFYRVITGPYTSRAAAEENIPILRALGLSPLVREYF